MFARDERGSIYSVVLRVTDFSFVILISLCCMCNVESSHAELAVMLSAPSGFIVLLLLVCVSLGAHKINILIYIPKISSLIGLHHIET